MDLRHFFMVLLAVSGMTAKGQPEYIGLADQDITSLDINYGIIAVGTDRNGVFWQYAGSATEEGWMHIALDSSVQAVYPHKSGPLGWAISAGISPIGGKGPFIYCSFNGGDFEENSDGIDPLTPSGITDLDGFPDPSICGETYAATNRVLYRRYYGDTTWHPVLVATIEGHLETVKVDQDFPGVVLAGGADGFAGILLTRSLDFGETWEDISPPGMTLGIDFAGASADTIFSASSDKVFLTADGGDNWTVVYENGIAFNLTEMLYDLTENVVYAAGRSLPESKALLIASPDFGETWQEVPLGDLDAIVGLERGFDGSIYFATRDEGVFRLEGVLSDVGEVDSELKTNLTISIYPNPVVGTTSIDYSHNHTEYVTLSVSDLTGTVVQTIERGVRAAGDHSLEWSHFDLPAGTFIVKLTTSKSHILKKVMILH